MPPSETALVVRFPQAEEVVGSLRARLDPAAALGVPAHVTVLSPFVPPSGLGEDSHAVIAAAVGSVPAFDVTLAHVAWFGRDVLYLAPEPAGPFAALTRAVWRSFPGYPPYRGAYEDVVPHLTVGMDRPAAELAEAARAVQPRLPVRAQADSVTLMQGSLEPRSWRVVAEFPLLARQ